MILLALALLAGVPDAPFAEAVEGWVIDRARDADQPLSAGLTEADARLVRVLGSPDYDARELASATLAGRGWGALRPLCWGARSTDPEIRSRCLWLLARLRCPACLGLGHRTYWYAEWSYHGRCEACDGRGRQQ